MDHRVRIVADSLRAAGFGGSVRELDRSAATAREAAEALGCPVGAIANSLVFVADDRPVLVLASGAHRVDLGRLAGLVGAARCRRATPEEVEDATGQQVGGVSPVGHPRALEVLIDASLRDHDEIWAAAGAPHAVFATTFEELRRVAGAREAVVA